MTKRLFNPACSMVPAVRTSTGNGPGVSSLYLAAGAFLRRRPFLFSVAASIFPGFAAMPLKSSVPFVSVFSTTAKTCAAMEFSDVEKSFPDSEKSDRGGFRDRNG